MEISRNKLILMIVSGIIGLFFAIVLIFMLLSTNNQGSRNSGNPSEDLIIWTVGEEKTHFNSFLDKFKNDAKVSGVIYENFQNFEDYNLALSYALLSGNGPDIFVMNNNEKNSLFENQIAFIPNNLVSPDFFRKQYKEFITEQLIDTSDGQEYLIGLPVGYEALGAFYHRRFFNSDDLSSIGALNSAISRIREKNSNSVAVAIGNGTTVDNSEDIFTQFLISEGGEKSISSVSKKAIQSGLSNYTNFGNGSENFYNKYLQSGKTATELFKNGEVFMVIGYPKLINKIDFSSSFLLAAPFPASGNNAAIINYNYFVINKDTKKFASVEKFFTYLTSDQGLNSYFSAMPYYLPAATVFERSILDQKINSKFNIKLGDFFDDSYNYTSFDKGIKTLYDKEIRKILDLSYPDVDEFNFLKDKISCKITKMIQASGDKSCE